MSLRPAYFLLLAALSCVVYGDEVYKWTDEKGKVHYGDAPADHLKQRAKKVELKTPLPSEAQRAEAEERAARNKEALAQREAEKKEQAASKPTESASLPQAATCEEQKRQYEESARCFNSYRSRSINDDRVDPQAYSRCVEVPRPQC